MRILDKSAKDFLYQQVVDFIHQQRKSGAIKAGDKLPSLRKLSQQFAISVPTVKQAYVELERQGAISAKPQSGYYLKAEQVRNLKSVPSRWSVAKPVAVECSTIIEQVYAAVHQPDIIAFGISNPVNAHPPDKALARLMRAVLSKVADKAVSYGTIVGDAKLRLQLALRYQELGIDVSPDDFIITNGAQEALAIALQCVAKPGDIIAIESPCHFGLIELIEGLGMKVLEIYTCADDGVCLTDLERAFNQHQIAACLFSAAINNPLGSLIPEHRRQALVQLIEKYQVPLIEDDVYGDLYFEGQRPVPAQLHSVEGLVITCSSFSKTVAPGYRLGWIIAGKYQAQAKRKKRALSCSTAVLQQWTLTEYIMSGDYDRHVQLLRKKLVLNCERMRALIAQHFPPQVYISQPKGGSVLWLRCRSHIDTRKIFHLAIAQGISFAPGVIFSPTGKYKNYMRISYGFRWHDKLDSAIEKLGEIVWQCYQEERT